MVFRIEAHRCAPVHSEPGRNSFRRTFLIRPLPATQPATQVVARCVRCLQNIALHFWRHALGRHSQPSPRTSYPDNAALLIQLQNTPKNAATTVKTGCIETNPDTENKPCSTRNKTTHTKLCRQRLHGFTLIEAMIALAIAAIITSLAWPNMRDLIRRQQADALIYDLRHAANLTRTLAISQREIMSLCPRDGERCGDDWGQGYFIFSDHNNNGIVDDNDRIIESKQLSLNGQRLSWRASARRNTLRFSPTGMAREFGRFTLCPDDGELRYARSLVVNRQGRVRRYYDRNGDGIVEDRNGDPPRCD